MPDYTKCNGDDCPLKNNCYRFTGTPSAHQSYFSEVPYDHKLKTCTEYWDNLIFKKPREKKVKEVKMDWETYQKEIDDSKTIAEKYKKLEELIWEITGIKQVNAGPPSHRFSYFVPFTNLSRAQIIMKLRAAVGFGAENVVDEAPANSTFLVNGKSLSKEEIEDLYKIYLDRQKG